MTHPIIAKVLKIFIILLSFFIGYLFIINSLSLLIPIFIVIITTVIIEPAVAFFIEKLKFPRPLSTLTVLLLLLVFLVGLIFLILTEVYEGMTYLSEVLPTQMQYIGSILEQYYQQIVLPVYESMLSFSHFFSETNLFNLEDSMNNLFNYIALYIGHFFESLLLSIPEFLAYIPNSFTLFVFIFLAIFLLSSDFTRIKKTITPHVPILIYNKFLEIKNYLKRQAFSYIRAQLILIGVTFILIFVGLFSLNINHALTIALIMFIIDLVPFIGTGIVFIPWLIYCFIIGDYQMTIGLSLLYMVIILTRQILEPKILSMHMRIHPLLWLFTTFIGYTIWGFIGIFIAPFILILLKGIHDAGIFTALIRYIKNDDKQ